MKNLSTVIGDNNVAVFGIGEFTADVEYIFDDLPIRFYISEEGNQSTYNGKPVYAVSELTFDLLHDIVILLCVYDQEAAFEMLANIDCIIPQKILAANRLFSLLDHEFFNAIEERMIVVWGEVEEREQIREDLMCVTNKEFTFLFDDSDACGDLSNTMKYFESFKEPYDQYIFVLGTYDYDRKKSLLMKRGLKENKDFVYYGKLLQQPSRMLHRVIYSPSYDQPVCPQPFNYAYVAKDTFTCCCSDWMSVNLGHPAIDSFEDMWNSVALKIIRLSIINKTFCFCNKHLCSRLNPNALEIPKGRSKIRSFKKDRPVVIQINFDYSCNLHCISCRREPIFANKKDISMIHEIVDKLYATNWINTAFELIVAGNGEVFFSKVYRSIIFDNISNKRNSISILSNGTLFEQEELDALVDRYKTIKIKISIDAATKKTYEKIRLGGNWENLYHNLVRIGNYRCKGKVDQFHIGMVVQKKNYHEMPDFVRLAQHINADFVAFSKLCNWGIYSENEFLEMDVFEENGRCTKELLDVLEDPILKSKITDISYFLNRA